MEELELSPGKFYLSRGGDLWCCFKVELGQEPWERAHCVSIRGHKVEYFYRDGRYTSEKGGEHQLITEVPAESALFENRFGD